MSEENRRTYYRLYYSESHCPLFRMNGVNYKVLDLSEEGLRFENIKSSKISFNDALAGTLNFPDGETYLVRGGITRLSDADVSVKLKTPLPLRKIVAEQRELISKFPRRNAS